MRIGQIAPPWIPVPPPAYGGIEAVVADLARGLSERGHEVFLFTVGESTSPVRSAHLFPASVRPMGQSIPEAAHVLAAYEALADEVDIIHDHTVLGPLVAARSGMGGPPVVTTNHGAFTDATHRIYREIARSAAVVAISHDQASRARDVPIAAVIHHGVDLEVYRPASSCGDGLVFVGRMSPDKGVAQAVQIARAAHRRLRIVSKMRDPDEVAYFNAHVRPLLSSEDDEVLELGLDERVEVLGEAAGLLNPIAWPEPFGLVMVEALATGTPVLARPFGAAPEIVTPGRTGVLFDGMAEGVRAVERLPEIKRTDCRADAEKRFSLQRMAADYEDLFESILVTPRLAPRGRRGRCEAGSIDVRVLP